jgi:TRAP-type C4-dicarboxylate transport system permease small subunit
VSQDGEGSERKPAEADDKLDATADPGGTAKTDGAKVDDKPAAKAEPPKRPLELEPPVRPSSSLVDAMGATPSFPDDGDTAISTALLGLVIFAVGYLGERVLGLFDREYETWSYAGLIVLGAGTALVGVGSRRVRKIDYALGKIEQAALFAILAIVVFTAATHAIKEKLTEQGLWWSFDIVRGGTFSIAMIGAAFATQQSRNLAMDLVSRRLHPRARLVLAIVLSAFTIVVAAILRRSGQHQVEQIVNETGEHLFDKRDVVRFIPIGCTLIIIHAFLHMAIDVDYLLRNKLPPERARSGH